MLGVLEGGAIEREDTLEEGGSRMSAGVKLQVALSLSVNCLTSGNPADTPGARGRMTIPTLASSVGHGAE